MKRLLRAVLVFVMGWHAFVCGYEYGVHGYHGRTHQVALDAAISLVWFTISAVLVTRRR